MHKYGNVMIILFVIVELVCGQWKQMVRYDQIHYCYFQARFNDEIVLNTIKIILIWLTFPVVSIA